MPPAPRPSDRDRDPNGRSNPDARRYTSADGSPPGVDGGFDRTEMTAGTFPTVGFGKDSSRTDLSDYRAKEG